MGLTIICDFDGVWVDSFAALFRINEQAIEHMGKRLSAEQYRAAFKGPIHHELRQLLGLDDAQQAEFSDYKRKIFPTLYNAQTVTFFPFAPTLIAELSHLGQLHIVTASPPEAVCGLLEQANLRDYFGEVAGFSLVGKRATLDRLCAEKPGNDTVFITDTVGDVREATGLKLGLIGVAWGFHQRDDLLAAGARVVVSDGLELKVCLVNPVTVRN
ncbi:MAG: HAD hydrolase-like protein [Cephaloticoccus sp.]|nr:HAD hydrolase-like protein [Cephaloticoccus sp.]MCF7759715.1 HAD hydrolase-like protein [Cephaloticoccus sp.]